ncbi:MAG: hypothetical protein IPK07_19440 [Deltaproteobacteria bacterium]|jgi:hypothetical protein|nr:hypothetical protein [Deltaproteobacteria bacterium]
MSTSAVSSQSSIQDLALSILNQYDTNKDGQLGATEFSNVLSNLLGGAVGSTSPTSSESVGSNTSATALGGMPASDMTGFNYDKIMNESHQTSKYLFARVAWNVDLASVHDKASCQALLESMVPDMQAAGMNVVAVDTDKIQVSDEYGTYWVDVIRDYDGPNQAFQWLSEHDDPTVAGHAPAAPLASAETTGSTARTALSAAELSSARAVIDSFHAASPRAAERAAEREERQAERQHRVDGRRSGENVAARAARRGS